jgi:hypothetical protein
MARRPRWCPRNPPSARRDRPWTGGAGRARRGRATAPAMPATSLSPLIGGGVVILGHLIRFGVSIWIAMQRRQPGQHQHLDRGFDRHDVRRHGPPGDRHTVGAAAVRAGPLAARLGPRDGHDHGSLLCHREGGSTSSCLVSCRALPGRCWPTWRTVRRPSRSLRRVRWSRRRLGQSQRGDPDVPRPQASTPRDRRA